MLNDAASMSRMVVDFVFYLKLQIILCKSNHFFSISWIFREISVLLFPKMINLI